MTPNRRAGFTLVELLIALVIFVLVAGSLYRVLNVSQRTAQTQTEKAAMQGSLRTGIQLAMAEIQELWSDEGVGSVAGPGSAISAMTATALTYEAMRGIGMTCAPLALNSVTLKATSWRGLLSPTAGQGIYIFDQGPDETVVTDDVWYDRTIQTVAGGTCSDGTAAIVLTLSTDLPTIAWIQVPGPARTPEAHGTGERYDLSLPLVYFVAGAALTVALSFAAAALAARAAPRAVSSAGLLVPLGPVQPFLFALARLMGLALFLLVIAAGLFGDPHPMKNLAPTFVWII